MYIYIYIQYIYIHNIYIYIHNIYNVYNIYNIYILHIFCTSNLPPAEHCHVFFLIIYLQFSQRKNVLFIAYGGGLHAIDGKSVYLVMPDRFGREGGVSAVPWRFSAPCAALTTEKDGQYSYNYPLVI